MTDIDATKQFRHLVLRLLLAILNRTHGQSVDSSLWGDVAAFIKADSSNEMPSPTRPKRTCYYCGNDVKLGNRCNCRDIIPGKNPVVYQCTVCGKGLSGEGHHCSDCMS